LDLLHDELVRAGGVDVLALGAAEGDELVDVVGDADRQRGAGLIVGAESLPERLLLPPRVVPCGGHDLLPQSGTDGRALGGSLLGGLGLVRWRLLPRSRRGRRTLEVDAGVAAGGLHLGLQGLDAAADGLLLLLRRAAEGR